ncbi:MAG: AarF/ABC1/UbiB kinase family protein [Phenylobacterium sp.]|uniref:ABC1 kinase family protein n=1 Tax=Phenylobacterium sp. TaxID=1871053 RepID=UPI0025CDD86A|nr:AarF/ABC1/UbiB kinase family protein [Phenylobacterium sp.]MCG9915758.1 AarF/ABC1/UbiB kinase family protein [Phenylobacterium sp.]
MAFNPLALVLDFGRHHIGFDVLRAVSEGGLPMTQSRFRKVPSSRAARLAFFGQMAGGVAGGMIAEGARRLASGQRPQLSDLLLTPGNALRVTEQLSRLRGAAMKLGQMISMDAGDLLPAELTTILARLRDAAHFMPQGQLNAALAKAWGPDWRPRFASFDMTPIAAASIGQVHRATLPDGRVLAIKVQYPGVAASIDADVDNVAGLLRLTGLLPDGLDIGPLLAEAKRQLHEEADYGREAEQMRRYRAFLGQDRAFVLPSPVDDLCADGVLAMDFIPGQPIEALLTAPQTRRDGAMAALARLTLRELFEFGYMQTDPSFANYRWQAETGRIVLLDFGAAMAVPPATAQAYRRLAQAGLAQDHAAVRTGLLDAGFVSQATLERQGLATDAVIEVLLERLGRPGLFDFADRAFVEEVRRNAEAIGADRGAWHVPPASTLFIQRKVTGMALLAMRMQVRLPLREMVSGFVNAPLV